MTLPLVATALSNGSLRDASLDRLACLVRHWTWADEAMRRFEGELASGWEYDEDLVADHPFGSYYHWCALLSGLAEAALSHALLSPTEFEPLRRDIEAAMPGLRACREVLVSIPVSFEEHPRVVDLLRDNERIGRLKRIHQAFGYALAQEHTSRQIDLIDP